MPDNNSSSFEGSFDFDQNNLNQETETLDWDRMEENCDRVTESYAWGAYEYEKVDCDNEDDYSDDYSDE